MTIDLTLVLGILLISLLAAWHVYIHNYREGQTRDCKTRIDRLEEHVRKLESLNASLAQRYIWLAEKVAETQPQMRADFEVLVNSMLKLYHTYQSEFPPGLSIEAEGDITVGGDVVGGSIKEKS